MSETSAPRVFRSRGAGAPAILLAILVLFAGAPNAEAQFLREQTPEGERLQFLIGEWQVDSTMHYGGESHQQSSASSCRWVIESLWLQCERSGSFADGRKFETAEWITWDELEGHYKSFHIDAQLTTPIEGIGGWTEEGTLEFNSRLRVARRRDLLHAPKSSDRTTTAPTSEITSCRTIPTRPP